MDGEKGRIKPEEDESFNPARFGIAGVEGTRALLPATSFSASMFRGLNITSLAIIAVSRARSSSLYCAVRRRSREAIKQRERGCC